MKNENTEKEKVVQISQKKGVFFIKTFDKCHARAEKMTGKDKVAISTTCLS